LGAMGAGRCILASDLKEIVDVAADTSVYFEHGSVEDLRAKLDDLLRDPRRIDNLGKSALARAKELYSWEKATDAYEALYREIL
jgi:glycosyltransferase involved in cell wall biosynthesis